MDPRWLRGTLATLHNICAPGACHAYQNVAYDAASEIVERVTGRPYGEVLRERLFAPLGMSGASISRAGADGSRRAGRGRHVGGQPRPTRSTTSITGCRRRAGSTARSRTSRSGCWRRWGSRADVLPPRVLAAVQTPRVAHAGREFPPPQVSRAHPGLRLRARLADPRLCRPPRDRPSWRRARLPLDDPVRSRAPRRRGRAVELVEPARPTAIEYEVMDMVYRLDRRDWLELDTAEEGRAGERDGAARGK